MLTKQKKIILVIGVVLVAAFLGQDLAVAKPIDLNLSLFIPQRHNRFQFVIKPWIQMIEERTKGQVKITPYFTSAINPLPEFFDATFNGIADIAEGVTNMTVGRFPLTETIMLPEMGFKNALNCSRALWHIYKTFPEIQKEWAGVKMLWHHTAPPMRIATTKKPVRAIEDLKGLKLFVLGSIGVKGGKALGFSPVTMHPGDIYMSLEKGIIDGGFADNEITVSRKLDEVIKYITNIEMLQPNFVFIMNQGVWDRLPADVKKVFDELSGEYMVEFTGKIRDEKEQEARSVIEGKGIEYIELPPAEKAKARELLMPVQNEYAAELEKKGLPGNRVLQELKKFSIE